MILLHCVTFFCLRLGRVTSWSPVIFHSAPAFWHFNIHSQPNSVVNVPTHFWKCNGGTRRTCATRVRVHSEGQEVGGHCLGMQLFPVFTTRDITLAGINHRVSLAPTAVTQTNHSSPDLLLLDITVSLRAAFELMWVLTRLEETFLPISA